MCSVQYLPSTGLYLTQHFLERIFALLLNVFTLTVSLLSRLKLLPEVPSPVIDAAEFRCPEEQVSNMNCWRIKTYAFPTKQPQYFKKARQNMLHIIMTQIQKSPFTISRKKSVMRSKYQPQHVTSVTYLKSSYLKKSKRKLKAQNSAYLHKW